MYSYSTCRPSFCVCELCLLRCHVATTSSPPHPLIPRPPPWKTNKHYLYTVIPEFRTPNMVLCYTVWHQSVFCPWQLFLLWRQMIIMRLPCLYDIQWLLWQLLCTFWLLKVDQYLYVCDASSCWSAVVFPLKNPHRRFLKSSKRGPCPFLDVCTQLEAKGWALCLMISDYNVIGDNCKIIIYSKKIAAIHTVGE